MSRLKNSITWLRQTIAWSDNPAVWQERAGLLAFILVAALLLYLSLLYLPIWAAVALWGVYGVALAICSRQEWIKLFGPVLFYDMVRSARRSRYVVMRLLYAGLLLFILCFMYLSMEARHGPRHHRPEVMVFAVFGFFIFLIVQVVLLALLMMLESVRIRLMLVGLLAVSAVLFTVAALLLRSELNDPDNLADVGRRPGLDAAVQAEAFFSVFMMVQLGMVVLLTPAYVAGAIAEEKDRKTLEFLLATDLHNREIVLSKFLSRTSNMALLLLTGVPILSLLQFIGGVDTQLMLAGFAGTALTLCGVASLCILLSTLFKKPRDAIGLSYLCLIAYMGMGIFGFVAENAWPTFMAETPWEGDYAPSYAQVSVAVRAGNPLSAVSEIILAIEGRRGGARTTLAAALPGVLERYAWFHIPFSLLCIAWSILRVRAIALRQTAGGTTAKQSWWERQRPPVGELPMLWKEFHIEGGRLNWVSFFASVILVLLTVGTGCLVVGVYVWDVVFHPGNRWQSLSESMNVWFRMAGTGTASLMLLHLAVRASTSISTERERDTFDALIATPLSDGAILAAKVVGCLTSMRLGWVWLGGIVALGLFTGGVHLLAVPILVVAWFVYAACFTMIGLWFSMVSKTSLRATVYTVLTTIAVGGGHWLITGMCCFPVYAILRFDRQYDFPEYFLKFQAGLTPPAVFVMCGFSWEDLSRNWRHDEFSSMFIFSLIGLVLWALGGVVFWFGLLVPKFREVSRREEMLYQ